jgi:hypothetical protein
VDVDELHPGADLPKDREGWKADLAFGLKVPLGRRATRAGESREQLLGETGNGTTVDLVHRLRLRRC